MKILELIDVGTNPTLPLLLINSPGHKDAQQCMGLHQHVQWRAYAGILSGFGASKAVPALGGGEMENEYYMCSIVVAEGCG